jgi:lipid-binding SYLF domain-containing protein
VYILTAVAFTNSGGGFVIGASLKESMIFIMNQQTLEALAVNNGLKIGAQAELTLAKWGRSYNLALNCSPAGYGGTVSLAFSKGLFGGLTLEVAVIGARRSINEKFYGTNASVLQIVMDEEVSMPQGTKIDEVYRKLDLLKNVGSAERT